MIHLYQKSFESSKKEGFFSGLWIEDLRKLGLPIIIESPSGKKIEALGVIDTGDADGVQLTPKMAKDLGINAEDGAIEDLIGVNGSPFRSYSFDNTSYLRVKFPVYRNNGDEHAYIKEGIVPKFQIFETKTNYIYLGYFFLECFDLHALSQATKIPFMNGFLQHQKFPNGRCLLSYEDPEKLPLWEQKEKIPRSFFL